MLQSKSLIRAVVSALAGAAIWVHADDIIDKLTEEVFRQSFKNATPEEWAKRLAQDKAQALCSQHKNVPPKELARQIEAEQLETIRYPDGGKLIGDWRDGEKLASNGRGGHIGKIQPDSPDTKRGGNCYACHALAPKEVAAGNLGPNLTGYGRLRGNSAEIVKYTYDKIYNAQAFTACSNMPRFGYHQWLTPKEIADTVAFLLDLESPVNKH